MADINSAGPTQHATDAPRADHRANEPGVAGPGASRAADTRGAPPRADDADTGSVGLDGARAEAAVARAGQPGVNVRPATTAPVGRHVPPETHFEVIELFFFAYRDFTSDPDEILAEYGFGRAHHRVLHFVNRNPGMPVAELLDLLKITKQSLARVLRDLIDGGYIEQQTGAADRRQRLLVPTPKGRDLALKLAEPQSRRIEQALAGLSSQEADTARKFLRLMINARERPTVLSLATKS